ncbi:MAG: MBL fold metallo-hydrolase [Gemmatimonadota bacterium]
MLLERYYDDSLAQASYLIACERSREAVVFDPNVLATFQTTLSCHRLKIRYVAESHIHADYLSGGRELARQHKATLLLSAHGGRDWTYVTSPMDSVRLIRDRDSIIVGMVRIDVMHTPGHTPEHLSFLITDLATGDRPMGLISGDFVFVGDVGRPDLLEKAAKVAGTMESSARELFASLQRLNALPDYLQIWPGHGAGSACGKALGAVPSSTLGYERLFNPALQHKDEKSFVQWVLADQPEPPPYFAIMKQRNRDGWTRVSATDSAKAVDATALRAALDRGEQVVDLRGSRDYLAAHVPGTINIPFGNSLVTYAGTVLRYDVPLYLLATSPEQALTVERRLALIGMEVHGVAGREALDALMAKHKVPTRIVDAATLSQQLSTNGPRLLDVRGRSEWNSGRLPKARHIYLGDLSAQLSTLSRSEPIVVYCQSGTRSSIAASLLHRAGFTDVATFSGGVDAWVKADLPLEKDDK